MKCLILLTTLELITLVLSLTENSYIETSTGPIQGVVVQSFTDQDVTAFFGIPYAEPPVGDLRFKPPVPVKPWTKVFKASQKPLPCFQHYTKRAHEMAQKNKYLVPRPWSEDCLKLNIWVPRIELDDNNVQLPIMVFIHGGSFMRGSSLLLSDGSTMAGLGGVFVVTMNYRLGPFGFLSFGHPDAPGNMGLMDQQLALKWIHENLPRFGKSVGKIFLWGVEAGAASTGYQILSPGSAGLFSSGSVRSEAPNCPGSFHNPEDSHKTAESLAGNLGCHQHDVSDVISCLRKKHPEDIVDATRSHALPFPEPFGPTVDGVFITDSPIELLRAGRFNNVSVIAATMAEDGSLILLRLAQDLMSESADGGMTRSGFREAMVRVAPQLGEAALNLVEEFYLDQCSGDDPIAVRHAAVKAYTDYLTDCCVNEFADYLSDRKNQVVRDVSHNTFSKYPSWMGSIMYTDQYDYFGYPILGQKAGFTQEEAESSKARIVAMMSHAKNKFSEFARLIHPYNTSTRTYTAVSAPGMTRGTDFKKKECSFWNQLLPTLQTRKNCTKQ